MLSTQRGWNSALKPALAVARLLVGAAFALITSLAGSEGAAPDHQNQLDLPLNWHVSWSQWLGTTRLIILYNSTDDPSDKAVIYDTTTRRATPAGGLLAEQRSLSHYGDVCWRVSPDRTKLLGYSRGHVVLDLSGHTLCNTTWASLINLSARWASDTEFVECMAKTLNDTTAKTTTLEANGAIKKEAEYHIPGEWTYVGTAKMDRAVLIAPGFSCWNLSEQVRVGGIADAHMPATIWPLKIPHLASLLDAAVSPDGRYVCWLALVKHDTADLSQAGVDGASAGGSDDLSAALWISTVDGQALHPISGFKSSELLSGSSPRRYRSDRNPSSLEWLPDGKTVSYHWKQRIWTVPVN